MESPKRDAVFFWKKTLRKNPLSGWSGRAVRGGAGRRGAGRGPALYVVVGAGAKEKGGKGGGSAMWGHSGRRTASNRVGHANNSSIVKP